MDVGSTDVPSGLVWRNALEFYLRDAYTFAWSQEVLTGLFMVVLNHYTQIQGWPRPYPMKTFAIDCT
jgi:hypothetical protein